MKKEMDGSRGWTFDVDEEFVCGKRVSKGQSEPKLKNLRRVA